MPFFLVRALELVNTRTTRYDGYSGILEMPWVIDADGLNNLALEIDRLRHAKTPPILTPHPG